MKERERKKRITAEVTGQRTLAPGIYDLTLRCADIAEAARAGQFVNLYCADSSRMLPRPISLAGVEREAGEIRLVYRISGAGTKQFAALREGDRIDLLGPLGNGFPLDDAFGRKVYLVGGGIGIPPLLETARALKAASEKTEITAVLGYRDKQTFLAEEFAKYGTVCPATEDGSAGTKGTVLDVLNQDPGHDPADGCVIFACGPTPMLRAVKAFAQEQKIPCWLSLEERMACGIGACLACICRTAETDEHSRVKNARVCKEGPVFAAEDVVI